MSRRPASRRQPDTPAHVGRPPGLTPDIETRLLEAIKAGVPVTQAAIYAGVSPSGYGGWMQRGREELDRLADGTTDAARLERGEPAREVEALFAGFAERVLRARSEVAVRSIALVQRGAAGGQVVKKRTRTFVDDRGRTVTETEEEVSPGDWRAAKWLLEVSFRNEFGQQSTVRLGGEPGGEPVRLEAQPGSPEVVASRLRVALADAAAKARGLPASGGAVIDVEAVGG